MCEQVSAGGEINSGSIQISQAVIYELMLFKQKKRDENQQQQQQYIHTHTFPIM